VTQDKVVIYSNPTIVGESLSVSGQTAECKQLKSTVLSDELIISEIIVVIVD